MTDPISGSADGYHAFISYRSLKSSAHARKVWAALMKVHGWRKDDPPPLRVFLDRISLKAGGLDERILTALRVSRCLIVLLDETTLDSDYVDKEIREWLAAGGTPERLFLVRTSPLLDLSWDEDTNDFRRPAALPSALRGIFLANQKFFDFALPARRVSEEDIVGLYMSVRPEANQSQLRVHERHEHQKRRAAIRRVIISLSVLLVLALVAGTMALVNFVRADESARQARADALAAESLLTLPVAPARAIDLAVESSRLADSTSIRSALLAVAADSSQLRGTFSLVADSEATSLTGLSLDAGEGSLTAWGPNASGNTDVVSWDATSRDVMQRFSVPRPRLESLVEVPGVAYLVCTDHEALRVDWRTHDVQLLAENLLDCRTEAYSTLGFLQTHRDEVTGEVFWVTAAGQEGRTTGFVRTGGSRTDVIRAVEEFEGPVVAVLGGAGSINLPSARQGRLVSTDPDTLVIRTPDDRHQATSIDGTDLRHTDLVVPESAVGVVSWRDGESGHKAAWITSDGAIGWDDATTPVHLRDESGTGGPGYVPSLTRLGLQAGLATVGGSVFRIAFSGSEPRVTRLEGRLPGPQTSKVLPIDACGSVAILGKEHFVVPGIDVLQRGRANLSNCSAVETGPPVKVNGIVTVEAGFAAPELSDVSALGSFFLGREDGTIAEFAFSGPSGNAAAVAPWQVSSRDEKANTTAPDGTTILLDGSPLVIDGTRGRITLGVGAEGTWATPRPDGKGGTFTNLGATWLAVQGEIPQMLAANCSGAGFEPAPGFLTNRAAAETPEAITRDQHGRLDCRTGREAPAAPEILSYRIDTDNAHIFSTEGGVVRLTTWRTGTGGVTTTALPIIHSDLTTGAVSIFGDRVALLAKDFAQVIEYRRVGDAWKAGHRYAATTGTPTMAAYSPDGALLIIATENGRFDIFDTTTGRRLGSQRDPLSVTSGKTYSRITTRAEEGLLVVALEPGPSSILIEVPAGTEPLRELLCRIHNADGC